ncbi:hypothetical protein GCM10009117_25710 [Gangjinia marincola]|uniref:DUF4280 domain-containing protein n=1 Tax=Gangjinia marincola TaxID=578463 RepID=A0ABN1MJT6_9FLAO
MSKKKYVPQGTYLACDKGTVPQEFKITNNNNAFLFEEPVANTGDFVPSVNVMPFGTCAVSGSACAPAPIAWQGFEDGIFVGNFNPLLEDSVLPCGIGGKIEIFYSLEEAKAACTEEPSGFWETLGKVALVVAAVALIVVTGGMAIAAIGAAAAATGALATTVAVTVAVLEVAGCALTIKALYDYSQDGDEEALFKEVALGFLFLGAGAAIAKGYRMYRGARVAKAADEALELGEGAVRSGDELAEGTLKNSDNFVESSFRIGDEIAGKPIKQIRQGNNGKTAIIGRKMDGHVNTVAEELSSQGKQVEVFNDTYQAGKTFDIDGKAHTWQDLADDFNDLSKYSRNEKGWIIDSDLHNTVMYKANKQWADKLIEEGFEVLDMGYPTGVNSESIFYNMELGIIF